MRGIDDKPHRAGGVDAVQALEEALHLAASILSSMREKYPGLRWEDADAGYFGFRSRP